MAWCGCNTSVELGKGAHSISTAEANANARLIAEAGTVATETGLTPRQLAEQRAELLEVVQGLMRYVEWINGDRETHPQQALLDKTRAAIAKAKGEQA